MLVWQSTGNSGALGSRRVPEGRWREGTPIDRRFPEKDKTDELAETLGEIFNLRSRDGESLRTWISRGTQLFDKCQRKTGVDFPQQARGWMILRWSGLSEEQQAVVKGRSLGDLSLDKISQAMRSVYPDFVVRRRTGVALVEDDDMGIDLPMPELSQEVQGFDDIETFLADFVKPDADDAEVYEEHEVAEVLAVSWKERRAEINRLQKQRKFSDAKELRRSFRVEVEELKKKTKCNRCHRIGHWARECRQRPAFNQSSSSSQPSGKESGAGLVETMDPIPEDEIHFIAYVGDQPSMLEQLRARSSLERPASIEEVMLVSSPGYGVLDSGCGKTIIGEETLSKFRELWVSAGVKHPQIKREVSHFRYGNGHVETSNTVVELPLGLAGKKGILQAAVVKGAAPLLVSRPALKRLGASIDFAQDQLSLFKGRSQVPLKVNAAGQYIVDVMQFGSSDPAEDPKPVSSDPSVVHVVEPGAQVGKEAEVLEVKTDDIAPQVKHEYKPVAQQVTCAAHPVEPQYNPLSKKQVKKLKKQVTHAPKSLGTKYAVVEAFSPPRVVPQVEKMGLRGMSLDKKQGFDLNCPKLQAWLLEELRRFPPELLILCPPCTDAGGWFNLNKMYMSMQEYLRRKLQLRKYIKFCKKLFHQQIQAGGRIVFEHPVGSELWQDPDIAKWRNDLTSFVTDMCCFDLHLPATNTSCKKLIKKSTRLLVSHPDMREFLCKHCPGETNEAHRCHATIAGSHPQIGSVSQHAGKYTPQFVQAMIQSVPALRSHEVLCLDSPIHDTSLAHEVLVADEAAASDEQLNQVLRRLRNNLGHPSQPELLRVLRHGQASARALSLAAKFSCPQCEANKRPALANPAQTDQVSVFNQKVGMDVKHLSGWKTNMKVKALNIVDYASNFQLMIPFFETETASLLRRLVSERWIAWAGPPKQIVLDPAQTNLGESFVEPCELEGTMISPTAAGAHWQLGKTEVHGGLFSKVLDRVIAERHPTTKDEWLDCVRHCHVKNASIQTYGFTPSQVVFGKNPDLPGELLNEPLNIVANTASLMEPAVEKSQAIRFAAKKAILELQDCKTMRRALSAKPRLARSFRAGDIVAYWRDQKWNQGTLSRGGRWYGSAVVLGHVGKNVVVVHRTRIFRCAPEQVRLATTEEKSLITTPETELLGIKDMLDGGTFRSAQFIDLISQSYPPVEDEVLQDAMSSPSGEANEQLLDAAENGRGPDAAGNTLDGAAHQQQSGAVPNDGLVTPAREVRRPESSEADLVIDVPPEQQVTNPDSLNTPGEPSSSGDARVEAPSDYGPIRNQPRRLPSKTGPMALYRPAPMKDEDFIDVMKEVVPHMLSEAVQGLKREASESADGAASKSARVSEQLSVEHLNGSEITADDALELWDGLQGGVPHETLVAQFMMKRLQKELSPSNNPPELQGQIDAAKVVEWNTLADKQAVRLLSSSESAWVRKKQPERIMGSRFVLTKKPLEDIVENGGKADPEDPSHWKVKARWCLQGHLDPDLSSKAREGLLQSPTLSQMGRMVLFQLIASHGWILQLGDIKGAFLEAGPLESRFRPLYASLPAGGLPGASSEQLVEILGNVYGQNDAPAAWYKVFDSEVLAAGFSRSRYDACLYTLRDSQNRLVGILGSHVDDTVTGGHGEVYEQALKRLKNRFPYRKWRISEGEFCGAHYKQCPKTFEIEMDQSTFASNLKPVYVSNSRRSQRHDKLNPKELSVLRGVNGSLNWLASQSRPDLSAQVSLSQQSMSNPTVHHLCEVNNIIRRAKQHADMKIKFKRIPPESLRLACHSDAAWANVGVYTQAGYVLGFTSDKLDLGDNAPWTPAVWRSYKLPRAVGSTLSAEAQAMASATGTMEWTSLLIAESIDGQFEVRDFAEVLSRRKPLAITDCKSLYDHLVSVSSPTAVDDRRTSIDIVIIRQSLARLGCSIRWVPTNRMLADCLTKDAGDPADLLRACIRQSSYQISPEETVLEMQAMEKQRRLNQRSQTSTPAS